MKKIPTIQMTILISIILIMKKWNNNNNNLDYETTAVALIILLSRECKVPRTIHRRPRYFQHLWQHHSFICPCLQIFSTTNHYNHRALNGCTKHECSWCQYSSIESQLTSLTLTSHWTCPHCSLLTHLDSYRHLSIGWSARNLRAWDIFSGRPFEPY